jgi:lon-related putative ATP-dependent protease
MTRKKPAKGAGALRLDPERLRWRCDPASLGFADTSELGDCPINIIGQPRAEEALRLGLRARGEGLNIFVSGEVGSGRSTVVGRALSEIETGSTPPNDLVYVHNFDDPDRPCLMSFPAGRGRPFALAMHALVENLGRDLHNLFDSEPYRKRRQAHIEAASAGQKARLKEFEKRVQEEGFTLVQVQMGPFVRSQLVPLVAGNPVEMDQLEKLADRGQFKREDLEDLHRRRSDLQAELEGLGKDMHKLERALRGQLQDLDRELAQPLVEEATREMRQAFRPEELATYLEKVCADLLANLDAFRAGEEEEGQSGARPGADTRRYQVNVVVDNSQTRGRPVIRETNPSYRNLFGTVEKTRAEDGEWETDHMRIKAGGLLRANGGFLVLDAMDVLVEPGVWSALKRTLRHRKVEIQSFDPAFLFSGVSLNPEPVPIDVKVIIIGTRQIYGLLYALDEDFKKIFKIKAEFAMRTPLIEDELANFSCLIHRRCLTDDLPPFDRHAVAGIVEHGVRLAGTRGMLTTRFTEITDLVREAGYWAREAGAPVVGAAHVEQALAKRVHRVDLVEELLRERIAEGSVLVDLAGEKIGQVNGLALLDLGDHEFALPSRITATTAMGRTGIIDIDREAEMSGSIHTKGVLILTGFLRGRFARRRPLTLTASLCFEQSYGGIDGDSASSAELYALLSSLSGVPLRQGIAVTGSVNQRGEVQPIGGVNRKIEGFFDLCSLVGLSGEQGVMIPARNEPQLMLRADVVEAVERKRFHVWAVSTIEEGLEVLTGVAAGLAAEDGTYPEDTVFGRADRELARLAEEVTRFGPADAGPR